MNQTLKAYLAGILVGFFIGLVPGVHCSRQNERSQASAAGVGRYVTNPKSGFTRFHYGVPGGPPKEAR